MILPQGWRRASLSSCPIRTSGLGGSVPLGSNHQKKDHQGHHPTGHDTGHDTGHMDIKKDRQAHHPTRHDTGHDTGHGNQEGVEKSESDFGLLSCFI
jgi:hypothetical protein